MRTITISPDCRVTLALPALTEKAEMILSLPHKTTLVLGTLAAATLANASAFSGDIARTADRCAVYGAGYADLGNGTCGHIEDMRNWNGGTASNAGLRTDGLGMLPGAGNARHLRVQADPDYR